MRNTILSYIAISILKFTSIAQQAPVQTSMVPIEELIEITFPKGIEKITAEQAQLITSKYKHITKPVGKPHPTSRFYSFGEMVMQLTAARGQAPEDHLRNLKSGMGAMIQLSPTSFFKSELKSLYGAEAMIINYEMPDEEVGYFQLTILNHARNAIVQGKVEYKKDQREKVTNLIYKVLGTVKFKE